MNEEIKYWKIGTSPLSMIKKFIKLFEKGMKVAETFRTLKDGNKNWIIDLSNNKILNLKSETTIRQHLVVWESLGFIHKKKQNYYSIITKFKKIPELIEYSKLFIKRISNNKKIFIYRNTIIINILVYLNILNNQDIENKNIKKTKGNLTIKEIKSIISNYEKELSKDNNFIKEILSQILKKNFQKKIIIL